MFNRQQVVEMTEEDPYKRELKLLDLIETVQEGGLKIEDKNSQVRESNRVLKTEIENNVEIRR